MKFTKSTSFLRLYVSVVVTICIGILLSITMFIFVRNVEYRHIQSDFNLMTVNSVRSLQREIENNIEVLRSLYRLYESNEFVTREEFRTFCKPAILRHNDILALEWVPRVPHSQRKNYERSAQVDGYPGFRITKREEQGKMVRADENEEYFPVYYLEPYKGNELALGYDVSTNPVNLEAVNKARDTGKMVATGRITLVQEPSDQYGFLVVIPVYRNDAIIDIIEKRRENLSGFTIGVFRIGDIVERSLAYLKETCMNIHIFDKSSSQEEQFLYASLPRLECDIDQTIIEQEAKDNDGMYVSHPLNVADRKWEILYKPLPGFIEHRRTWFSLMFLYSGFLITGLLSVYLRSRINKTIQVEEFVSKLTIEITERKRVEEALKEGEKKYRTYIDSAPNGIFVVDSKGKYLEVNEAACQITGFTKTELLSMSIPDLVYPEALDTVMDEFAHFLSEGNLSSELLCRHKDDSKLYLSIHAIRLEKDKYIGFCTDITEQKQVSQKLQRINKQLQISIEQMPAGYILWDKKFRVLEWNHAAERIFGYSKSEVLGKFALDIIVPEDIRQQVGKVVENLQEGKVASYSEKNNNIRKDGKLISCQWHNIPLKSGTGKTFAILSMIEDITEKKKMEEVLLQSEKLKSIGTITSGVAHEFNNILAIISGNVQLLEGSRKDDEELTNALSTIKRAANDGAEISKRMLKFTKTAKDMTGFVSFDISELINVAIDFTMPRWKNMAQAKGINYHIERNDKKELPAILCNPTELREVFMNIINNALDAMPDGGRISFNTWSREDIVFISISDNGEGMPEAVRKNIFVPFFTTKLAVGTGLGMSTAYGIITGHGGKIEVESKIGKGTIFTLQFPVAVKTVSPMISPEAKQEMKTNNLRILVVDDEKDICDILDKFFSKEGHLVKTINNGSEAIILTKATDYDLVLCDISMPDVFGYDVIRALNELEKRPKIGIITGWCEKLKPLDDEELKVDFILKKPFDFSELTKHINDVFGTE